MRASDDNRYGLEYLSRVTSTQTQNVKLNSLMRGPPPLFNSAERVWLAIVCGRCVPECANDQLRCREWMWPREPAADEAVLSPRGRPISGRTASGNGRARASVCVPAGAVEQGRALCDACREDVAPRCE